MSAEELTKHGCKVRADAWDEGATKASPYSGGYLRSILIENPYRTEHLAAILDAEGAQGSEAEVELANGQAAAEHSATLIRHGDHWARFECCDLSIESTDVPAVIEQGLAHLTEEG